MRYSCNFKINSITKNDLPTEFTNNAFKTVDNFIRKTYSLEYEWAIFFDYITGNILKCTFGKLNEVELHFEEGEFDNHHVASIHNHPHDVFSPPSGKNFGILKRNFEDYELIVGKESFWIFKAKGLNEDLIIEFNIASILFFNSAREYCSNRYNDPNVINNVCDVMYGNQLLKYINNKNINDIQLTKKEYTTMTIKSNKQSAGFSSFKRTYDPDVFRIAREREQDPSILSGKDMVYAFYQMMGMEIDYDEIFAE